MIIYWPPFLSLGHNMMIINAVKTRIDHPCGTGFYHLFMVMTGGWFIIV